MPRTKAPAATKLVSFLLDRSGSMDAMRKQAVDGFNNYLDNIKAEAGLQLAFCQFDSTNRHEVVRTFTPVSEFPQLTRIEPRGGTPLYDAIALNIEWVEQQRATPGMFADEQKPPVLLVIMTDGQENASANITTVGALNALIKAKEADGFTFIYLGVEKEAWSQFNAMFAGTASASNVKRSSGAQEVGGTYYAASAATTAWSNGAGMTQNLSEALNTYSTDKTSDA